MLTPAQIKEMQTFLKKAENPLFFFDDDPDGLAAALTLKKKYDRGHLIPLKISPISEQVYLGKVQEYSPDAVFILDRPIVSQNVLDNIHVPVIWIDHHEPIERFNVHYYNPMVLDKEDNRCTSYWAYQIAKKNMWIAMVGIIADWQIPDFINKFRYKKLFNNRKTPPEILFDSDFGTLTNVFGFILKGQSPDVKKSLHTIQKIKSPYDILNKATPEGKYIYRRYEKVNRQYTSLLKKAVASDEEGEPFVFTYPDTKTSFTGILSNELLYRLAHHDTFIIARLKDNQYRISIRGRKRPVLPILKKALLKVEGYGGGHQMACGASVKKDDFAAFINVFRQEATK